MEKYIMIRKLNEINNKIAYIGGYLAGRNVDDDFAIEITDDIFDCIYKLIVDLYKEEDKENARARETDPMQG